MSFVLDLISQTSFNQIKNVSWNRIPDIVVHTSLQTFAFEKQAFYTRMMQKTVNSLVDTGIMKYLVDFYLNRVGYLKVFDIPKVLKLDDLEFGFNIWLAFCGFSLLAFMMEKIFKPVKKFK